MKVEATVEKISAFICVSNDLHEIHRKVEEKVFVKMLNRIMTRAKYEVEHHFTVAYGAEVEAMSGI
jgi:hypothetical protein